MPTWKRSTAGSVILAAVLLKMGTYGFIRFSLPLLPKASIDPWIIQVMAFLSIVAIIYGALVSLMQEDWKKLVAYSSVSHLGFCTLGIFSLNPNGIAGSVIQQINHGISTGMLFLIVGSCLRTPAYAPDQGVWRTGPRDAELCFCVRLRHAELGRDYRFLTDLLESSPSSRAHSKPTGSGRPLAVTGVILGAAYLLWLYQRTMLGQITNIKNLRLPDLNLREWAVFLPFMAWAIWIGVYPKPYFDILEKPVANIVERVRPDYFKGSEAPENSVNAQNQLQVTKPATGLREEASIR